MLWTVDFSEEVREWYLGLTPAGKAAVDRIATRLESVDNQLRMPHSRPLGDGLYELRFTCENVARRITYVFEPQRRAVTLTTFRKQKQNERGEVLRARRAQAARAEELRRAADVEKATKKKGRASS
ncbi:type II toxin-antitoxin system RelE/ParE family toxin [Promicromonospora sp. CA-289599]|uniref:type II toxin-antitoxin system RelE/ParE family toxin n=1 Tax=Promicromonospora sp. CA-289599 TaxID=3240014 RepID=UPI003D8DF2A7